MTQEKNWQGKVIPFAAFAAFCYFAWGLAVVVGQGVAGFEHPVAVVCGTVFALGTLLALSLTAMGKPGARADAALAADEAIARRQAELEESVRKSIAHLRKDL